jgi:hypothetical protein
MSMANLMAGAIAVFESWLAMDDYSAFSSRLDRQPTWGSRSPPPTYSEYLLSGAKADHREKILEERSLMPWRWNGLHQQR